MRRPRGWGGDNNEGSPRFLPSEGPAGTGAGAWRLPRLVPWSELKVSRAAADKQDGSSLGTDGNHNQLRSGEKGRRMTPPFSLR